MKTFFSVRPLTFLTFTYYPKIFYPRTIKVTGWWRSPFGSKKEQLQNWFLGSVDFFVILFYLIIQSTKYLFQACSIEKSCSLRMCPVNLLLDLRTIPKTTLRALKSLLVNDKGILPKKRKIVIKYNDRSPKVIEFYLFSTCTSGCGCFLLCLLIDLLFQDMFSLIIPRKSLNTKRKFASTGQIDVQRTALNVPLFFSSALCCTKEFYRFNF